MEERLVSFEVAKLLKERGFIGPTERYYYPDGSISPISNVEAKNWNNSLRNLYSAPTQQSTTDWIRINNSIHISIMPYVNEKLEPRWSYFIWLLNIPVLAHYPVDKTDVKESCEYKEVVDKSIAHVLKNLDNYERIQKTNLYNMANGD